MSESEKPWGFLTTHSAYSIPLEEQLPDEDEKLDAIEQHIREYMDKQEEQAINQPFELVDSGGSVFRKAWLATCENIERSIDYDTSWVNARAYYEHLSADPDVELEYGEMVKTMDTQGRYVILIHTRVGTVVLYEDSQVDDDDQFYLGGYIPHSLAQVMGFTGDISLPNFQQLVGHNGTNIGTAVENLLKDAEQ